MATPSEMQVQQTGERTVGLIIDMAMNDNNNNTIIITMMIVGAGIITSPHYSRAC